MKGFIVREIKKQLISQGVDEANADWCANQGYAHYEKRVSNSKDPFKEACDYAGLKAEERCLKFKYRSPKAKVKRRAKKPQEAFNFGGR